MDKKLKIAEEINELSNTQKVMEEQIKRLQEGELTKENLQIIEKIMKRNNEILAEELELEELKGIRDFYKTKVGKVIINKMPKIMQQCQAAGVELFMSNANLVD